MTMSRMLVAGVGNIFLGDDGFGVEVARRLATAELPDWVRVADYGISGMHLAYDLADGYESAILIDATPRGGEPGTVYIIELEPGERPPQAAAGRKPALRRARHAARRRVRSARDARREAGRMLVVGCEPASVDHGIGLSAPVAAAVDEAVRVVLDLVAAAAGSERNRRPYRPTGQSATAKGWSHVPWHTR